MIYLSKGVLVVSAAGKAVRIARGSEKFILSEKESELWHRGHLDFSTVTAEGDKPVLKKLINMSLAEAEENENMEAEYSILTRCICCPVKPSVKDRRLSEEEKTVLYWLRNAGLRLTTAELVYLTENRIKAESWLIGAKNRQSLVETIYTPDTIADNILESNMAKAGCRDSVVRTLMGLLRKKES